MNFVDKILVRLADPALRSDVFGEAGLERLAGAGYDTEAMSVEGPFQPVFDEFRLGFAVPKVGSVEGSWSPSGGSERVDARFVVTGVGSDAMVRVDALWRGAIVARTVLATTRVSDVVTAWPSLGTLDAEIEADLGALPPDPALREQERRTRFLQRMRDALDQQDALNDARFDAWLASVGAASVSDLVTRFQGTLHGGAIQVTFAPAPAEAPTPRPLPVAVAVLVRDMGFSLADLLAESKMVREQLRPHGLERRTDPAMRIRTPLLVAWIVPESVFDDADWPGGASGMNPGQRRAARLAQAGQWLAGEGIGLLTAA